MFQEANKHINNIDMQQKSDQYAKNFSEDITNLVIPKWGKQAVQIVLALLLDIPGSSKE